MRPVAENKSDNDQGYCSFGERKDDSPEDENRRKPRSSTWRGKRSMSITSNASDDSNSTSTRPVLRRKNEMMTLGGRNIDTRKS